MFLIYYFSNHFNFTELPKTVFAVSFNRNDNSTQHLFANQRSLGNCPYKGQVEVVGILLIACPVHGSAKPALSDNVVNLRIEANSSTLWEGPIKSGPRYINVSEGPYLPYQCDGTLGYLKQTPGNTPTDAMDEASKLAHFTYDGESFEEDYDIDIYQIGPSTANFSYDRTLYYFWAPFINYQVSATTNRLYLCGCHDVMKPGDDVLWAFMSEHIGADDTNPLVSLLKLSPTAVTVKKGKGTTVTVIDGRSGNKTQGASVAGVKTNAQGKATLYFSKPGFYQFKAHRTGDVRSNVINITVTN